jgi:pyruvate/2-oxoglutarate dehydrogenase complex dihydrolipoamide dehydrogenase (E3) component
MAEEFDVICIGAGPAGEALTSALKGSGLTLAVIESNLVGGECAYWGCMPSKTLLRSAETLTEAGRARELAASSVEYTVDYPKIHKRTSWMARDLNDANALKALEDQGARVIRGQARLTGARSVEVDGTTLTARRAMVIATGTSPAIPPIRGIENVDVWTNREAVLSPDLPHILAVIGAGAVGVEIGQAFRRFGSQVHMFESTSHVLPPEEPEAGNYLQERLVAEGVKVSCSAEIVEVEQMGELMRVPLKDGSAVECDHILVATGRKPNLEGFDLAAAGIETTERGWIKVDPQTLLAAEGIYAAGDVNGLGGFTHLSHYHGTWIGRMLRGEQLVLNHTAIPRVTFTDPEVASVGLTEAQARAQGIDVKLATADVGNTARGYIHGEPGGLIKLVADGERQVLVGATIVSPRAGEMISELALAMRAELPITLLQDLVHPFPTFSRVLQGVIADL